MLIPFLTILFGVLHKITCQLQCLEVPINANGPLGTNYIGTQAVSDNGACALWTTASGNINYNTSSQFPDISIQNAKNYCRNPISSLGIYEPRPWCWLQSTPQSFGYCTITSCSSICRNNYIGVSYTGTVSTTISGKTCQSWGVQTPHAHSFNSNNWPSGETIQVAGNNCRNPNNSPIGLWCYTTDSVVVWEPCMAPLCQSTLFCVNNIVPYSFKSLTATEQYLQPCEIWQNVPLTYYNYSATQPTFDTTSPSVTPIFHPALLPDDAFSNSANLCRNPDNDTVGAWCYVKSNSKYTKMYCKTPCTGIWACAYDRVAQYYQGKIAVTETNLNCLSWASKGITYNNPGFPDTNPADAQNYCRNPTNDAGGPWCWLANNPIQIGYCSIPSCAQKPPIPPLTTSPNTSICQLTATGTEYTGTISISLTSKTCQSWSLSTPNYNPYFNRSALFNVATMAEVSNYCRNPNKDSNGPWCYTTTGGLEYCNIPKCGATTIAPITRNTCRTTVKAEEYTGTINSTANGTPCVLWTSVTNLPYNNSNFADGSLQNAVNYCRNPQATDFIGPFCFAISPTGTTDRTACVVPICNTSTCRTTVEGYTYIGTQATTKSGKACLPWTSLAITTIEPNYLPDATLVAAKNYCRNPSSKVIYDGPFCYTTLTTAETCGINYCQIQCRNTQNGQDYAGIINRSSDLLCRMWNDPSNILYRNPVQLNAATLDAASNYCRNPSNDPVGAWCYTAPQTVGYCQIPVCTPSTACYDVSNAWSYKGTISTTISGQNCSNWIEVQSITLPNTPTIIPSLFPEASLTDSSNYCRTPTADNSYNSKPWCYVTNPIMIGGLPVFFDYCNVTICTQCYTIANASSYNGFVNTTSNGTPCLQWSTLNTVSLSKLSGPSFSPSLLTDSSINAASSYCRTATGDPSYLSQPWCYVSPSSTISASTGQNFGYCNVTTCPMLPPIIPITTYGTIFMSFIMVFSVAVTSFSLSSTAATVLELTGMISDNVSNASNRPLPPEPQNEIINNPKQYSMLNNTPISNLQTSNNMASSISQNMMQSGKVENSVAGPNAIGSVKAEYNAVTMSANTMSGNNSNNFVNNKYQDIFPGYSSTYSLMVSQNPMSTETNANFVNISPKVIATESSNNYLFTITSNIDSQNNTLPGIISVDYSGRALGGNGESNISVMQASGEQSGFIIGQGSSGGGGQGAFVAGQGSGSGGEGGYIIGQGSSGGGGQEAFVAGQGSGGGGQGGYIIGKGSSGGGGQGAFVAGQRSGGGGQSGFTIGQGSGSGGGQGAFVAGQGSGGGGQSGFTIGQGSSGGGGQGANAQKSKYQEIKLNYSQGLENSPKSDQMNMSKISETPRTTNSLNSANNYKETIITQDSKDIPNTNQSAKSTVDMITYDSMNRASNSTEFNDSGLYSILDDWTADHV